MYPISGAKCETLATAWRERPRKEQTLLSESDNASNRSIGSIALTGVVVNSVIGAGIFALPGEIARLVHRGAPYVYVLGFFAMAPIAGAYVLIGTRIEHNGGQYTYVRSILGETFGTTTALYVLVVRSTSAAVVVDLFVKYLAEFIPAAHTLSWRIVAVLGVVALLAIGNTLGVKLGVRLSSALSVLKLASLAAFVGAGYLLLSHPHPVVAPSNLPPASWTKAVSLLVFAYGGFDSVLCPAGEVKSPKITLPLALGFGLGTIGVFYFLVQLVATWSGADLENSPRPLAEAARVFAGASGAAAMSVAAVISTLGWLCATFVTVPQFIRATAERGDFFPAAGKTHSSFGTPHIAILIWAAVVCVLGLGRDLLWNVELSVGARLLMYSIATVALLRDQNHPLSVLGRITGFAGLALCVALFHIGYLQALVLAAIFGFSAVWTLKRSRRIAR